MSKQKVVVITGDQSGIGKCVKESFEKNGAIVCGIDIQEGSFYHGDIADEKVLEAFVSKVITHYQKVDIIINNALPIMKGIDDCTYEEFQHALSVGVTAPFYLVKLLKPHLSEGASIVNISSTRAMMSQAQTESYSAAKGGIHALTHALAVSLSGIARVNAISPGWIDTTNTIYKGANAYQHPAGRVGKPEDIAEMVKFLCSEEAAFITGENITIDGGMSKLMIYHNDQGWSLQ
ncbi:SDR family oxidoreductase [Macrococcoides caseolyticum]|uniref:SDR family oxidoreductase n=1 Tax=Macrococcoides caseolyticum TaxID=69966 RepID=UPI0024BCC791|nr:SDR family oxidoreductase [Macrococcus caseolyticus]MDJ1088437.1 SDR family oxidoreductase [Macrococcus caseolyticus]